jgi:glucosylceramidase
MQANGITINAVTVQNEPLNPSNNPSMYMIAPDEDVFVKKNLGPAFAAAKLSTKIIIWDHNCDVPQYPLYILADTAAYKYVDGSAFHLYAGYITALTQVHDAFPGKNVYFTEQWVGGPSNFGGDFAWHMQNLIIGAPNNWSKNVLEWNLASDPDYNPHTAGGCSTCLGALTITGTGYTQNTSYYVIAHASKFVRPGSVRVYSSTVSGLNNVAYRTPTGQKVLIVLNSGSSLATFNISFNGKIVTTSLTPGAAGTYIW